MKAATAARRMRQGSGLLVLLLGVLFVQSVAAQAAGSYAFDAQRALTGNCSVSSADPVPDPGCPGGVHPPAGAFSSPRSVATDRYGNIYVANWGQESAEGGEGRIDIFDPSGYFLYEFPDPAGPRNLTIDGDGNLYVYDIHPGMGAKVVRYSPTVYDPEGGNIEYGNPPTLVEKNTWFFAGLAIDPSNNHLFVNRLYSVAEYSSAKEDNVLLDEMGAGTLSETPQGLAVDAARGKIYASDGREIDIFRLEAPHDLLGTIDGAGTPPGKFSEFFTIAVDESNGALFIYDGEGTNKVYQLSESGHYLSTIDHDFGYVYGATIGIDNGPLSPNKGYLYVPSHPSGVGHAFAFGPPPPVFPPVVESVDFREVSEHDAELQAVIDTGHLDTGYTVELVSQRRFEEEGGFGGGVVVGRGEIPAEAVPVEVSVLAAGLEPGTTYRFRVVSSNAEGSSEAEGSFSTYPTREPEPVACPNRALRVGASALLPDCRAYELVTPADTNGRSPQGVGYLGTYFATREVSPAGAAVSFQIEGGSLPGYEGTGSYAGDPYLSIRTGGGWQTIYAGPTADESPALLPGSTSPDQGYSFWSTGSGKGSAAVEGNLTSYVRYPDGHSALIGRGSVGSDPQAAGKLISPDGRHIVFVSGIIGHPAVPLEANSPPAGTRAVYDRTADEVTHVVSLYPGNKTPTAGENASYVGASADGSGIAFEIGGILYLRYNNEATYEVGEGLIFAGMAADGRRLFYLKEDDLYAYEVGSGEGALAFSSSGDVTPVNVADDGKVAYFVSPAVLTDKQKPNPRNAKPVEGANNLYRSQEGSISFIGTVTDRDVEGEDSGNGQVNGLGLWTKAVGPGSAEAPGRLGLDPSRTTPDGNVLLFESRADLAEYDLEGRPEIYRYGFLGNQLTCLSCNPTGRRAIGEASLQSVARQQGAPEPFGSFAYVNNLRADGKRAFFQSTEPLVVGDTDGLQDVYEWEAKGTGSCQKPGGCVYLISSGHGSRIDYLYGVSDSGDDVFFRSSDLLTSSDIDEAPSIYDARVGGGFPEEGLPPLCLGEECRPGVPVSPAVIQPESAVHRPARKKRCPRTKRKVVRHKEILCVKRGHHRKHRRHRKAAIKGKGAS